MKKLTFAVFVLTAAVRWIAAAPQPTQPRSFATPQEAAQALIDAASRNDSAAMLNLFGAAGKEIVDSRDATGEQHMRENFVARAHTSMRIESEPGNPDRATVVAGENDWPFPVPLVRKGGRWYFDAAQGKLEIRARRIGRHEMIAIDVCRGYVEAQMEYASHDRDSHGILKYAQHIINSPGKKDGLYQEGEQKNLVPKSFAEAAAARLEAQGKKPVPYHGYYFHILRAQGPDAPGGAMDYVVNGEMIGGFALVAWPAEYGVSGIKTFLVSHHGVIYQKDLGPATPTLARAVRRFNPDKTWKVVDDE